MKPPRFGYERPDSVEEAVSLRARFATDASVLAGGQSLIPMLNFRLARPEVLIDLGGVRDLTYVREHDGGIAVGAMARQRDLEQDEAARRLNPLLAETLGNVAHTVVRNRGTVVGSIAHADASAELPTVFTALDGRARATGPRGERTLTGDELFLFHMTNALEPDELLTEVWFPALPGRTGYAFEESARRHGDYALAGVCATLTLDPGDAVVEARLACCGVATRPARAREAERLLVGRDPGDDAFEAAGVAVRDVVDVSDDIVASQELRRHLVQRLTVRALRRAAARAIERREA